MKRIAILIVVIAAVAVLAAPMAGAKPVKAGPAVESDAAVPASVETGWPGILAGAAVAVVAVGGGAPARRPLAARGGRPGYGEPGAVSVRLTGGRARPRSRRSHHQRPPERAAAWMTVKPARTPPKSLQNASG